MMKGVIIATLLLDEEVYNSAINYYSSKIDERYEDEDFKESLDYLLSVKELVDKAW